LLKIIHQKKFIFTYIKIEYMATLKANSENIERAAKIIRNGGLVAFPTETVYGLGANGFDGIAAAKIFEIKKRPSFNPLILHISDLIQLKDIVVFRNFQTQEIIKRFWPGPLTIVLEKTDKVPDIITAGNPTVAVRMPSHRVALELLYKVGGPIAAPSANEFGQLSPTEATHVEEQIGKHIDIILDGGPCEVGVESTIIEIGEEKISLLRHGGIPVEEIEEFIGKEVERKQLQSKPNAPGQLDYHYAPKIPINFMDEANLNITRNKKVGALFLSENTYDVPFASVKILSTSGNLQEAAANLFSLLHDFETENLDLILCEKIEKAGLGWAIMDRLTKAVNKFN
jgi:L-threonylcarbamoyladenylate synthase